MAYQVQSNIDPLLSNLVASEEGIAQRGMQGLAQQQSMALAQQQMGQQERLAQMGMFQSQAEMQHRMALEQQRQQFEQGQQTSRQQFELQQNQMLMAAQQKAARDAQESSLALKQLEVDYQIAKAEGRINAANQLQMQMSPLKKKQADAAVQQSIVGKRLEMTQQQFDAYLARVGEAATKVGQNLKVAQDNAGRFTNTAKMNMSSAEIRKAAEAVEVFGIKESVSEMATAGVSGYPGLLVQKLLSLGVDLPDRELGGLQYMTLAPSAGIEEMIMPGVERSAGLVQRVDSQDEIRKKVSANAVESLVATLSTIPGQKQFNADAARTALEALLAGGGQTDPTQQLVAAGVDPTTVKIILENLAISSNESALGYDTTRQGMLAQGGNRSLRSMALEVASLAEREKMSMFANAAARIFVTGIDDLELMTQAVNNIRRSGRFNELVEGNLGETSRKYGLGQDFEGLVDYLSEGRQGPGMRIRSRQELEGELLSRGREKELLDQQLADLVSQAEMTDVGGQRDALLELRRRMEAERKRLVP